ncbi:MAG TPA: MlaD family protein [Solirubrobacteraceae bacterium]|nr:MlaD family protein [Solirubrobacteraceae bacterium]
MKRVLASAAILLAIGAFVVIAGGASNSNSAAGTYKIQLDNAFGLVTGADFKVAGVRAGKIQTIELPKNCIDGGGNPTCRALVTVQVTQSGFGSFKSDAFCQSRPQSLIGEYFIDCQPGQYGKALKPGSTIPVTDTESTIPADLVQDVMRLPYRQRFTLIINELGAAVAGRSGDLQSALRRAVPALTETDNLLNLLANDSHTLQQLTADSNSVITALANNSKEVNRFIVEAGNTARDTAAQDSNLRLSLQRLPGLLEQLRPAMAKLGASADANEPVLANLNSAAKNFNTLLRDLPAFSNSALPAIKSLGQASVTGKAAVVAANPTIKHLNQFAKPTPELGQNLSIVLHDLDDRSRAVEPDPRSPGGKGYTGLEALLQYVFIQPLAINTFGPFGHLLAVDAFASGACGPYATPSTIAATIKQQGLAAARQCYSMLGPDQPGVTTTDPSDPSACVPDPGGAPPGEKGRPTNACKLQASAAAASPRNASARGSSNDAGSAGSASSANASGSSSSGGGGGGGSPASAATDPAASVQSTLGQIAAALGGGSSPSAPASSGGQTQQLLNYLLAP